MNYCLKNGMLIDPATGRKGEYDIMVRDGKITAVGSGIQAVDCEIVDLTGLIIIPGLIDAHVHLREPGYENKETIATGTEAAAAGGFTAVAAMPNTNPPADNAAVIEFVKSKAKTEAAVRVYPVGNITKNGAGKELAELGEMVAAGAVAFSDDGSTVMNAEVQRCAFTYGQLCQKVFLLHCEDKNLAEDGVMHEGLTSTRLGLKGIPGIAEELIIARDIQLAEDTGAQIHICHVSTKKGVELIREAKIKGLPVTAEVTPHHLILIDEDVSSFNTATKVNPPLRSKEDREALIQGLLDGTIDIIATDHAPHTREEKHCEYNLAPFGIIGLETALGLVLTEFVHKGVMSLEQMVKLMSARPAGILNIPGGTLAEGVPADLTVIDPNKEWEVRAEDFRSKAANSPFIGRRLCGKTVATMVAGRWVYNEREKITE